MEAHKSKTTKGSTKPPDLEQKKNSAICNLLSLACFLILRGNEPFIISSATLSPFALDVAWSQGYLVEREARFPLGSQEKRGGFNFQRCQLVTPEINFGFLSCWRGESQISLSDQHDNHYGFKATFPCNFCRCNNVGLSFNITIFFPLLLGIFPFSFFRKKAWIFDQR